MLKKEFVEKKVDLIQEELVKLSELKDLSLEEISKDFYKYNTLERLLEKIIMRATDINQHLLSELATSEVKTPETYKETFLELPKVGVFPDDFAKQIAESVGTRNVLVHDYDNETTNYKKIYSSVSNCLKDYTQYCDYILKFLEKKKNKKSKAP